MTKSTSPSKKINWESIKDKKLPISSLTPVQLIKRLEASIFDIKDSSALIAIVDLRFLYLGTDKRQAKIAEEILKRLLIPTKMEKVNMRAIRKYPDVLFQMVEFYKKRMKPGWEKGGTARERRMEALKCLEVSLTTEDMGGLLTPKRDESFTDFVLLCLSRVHHLPPAELKKFFYEMKKKISNADHKVTKT